MKNLRILGMFAFVLLAFSCTDNLLNNIELEQSQGDNPNLFTRESEPSNTAIYSTNELIVQYKEVTTTEQIADFRKIHQEDIAKVRACKGCVDDTFIIELWELVEGIDPIEKKGLLKGDGGGGPEDIILAVDSEFTFMKKQDVNTPAFQPTYNTDFTPLISNNRGIIVGVVDTGVDAHYNPAFNSVPFLHDSSNVCIPEEKSGWDFANNDNEPYDGDGHGTKVTYIIASKLKKLGVPFKILPVKVFKDDRSSSYFTILCGVNYALKNSDVVNLSFGYYLSGLGNAGDIFKNLLNRYSNIPVIASAGNDDQNNDARPHYPSSHQLVNVISVAAADQEDKIASFSNFGFMHVLFSAIGQDISFPTTTNAAALIHDTSFSAATVTAKTAEFLHLNNGNPYIVKDIINYLDAVGKPLKSGSVPKPIHYSKLIE